MDKEKSLKYEEFIKTLDLQKIQPLVLQSERLGDFPKDNSSQIKLNWNMNLRKIDPEIKDGNLIFAPKFEFDLSTENTDQKIFHQLSIFEMKIEINNVDEFQFLWNDSDIKKVFTHNQIIKTVWPLFRQNVIDGLTRLSLPAISLPWIV